MTNPEHEAAAPTPLVEEYVMVPREPTDQILIGILTAGGVLPDELAAMLLDTKDSETRRVGRELYQAMIAAAPPASTAQAQRIAELEAQGVCMCGEPIADHSGYENHSPVSQYDYRLAAAEARIAELEGERDYAWSEMKNAQAYWRAETANAEIAEANALKAEAERDEARAGLEKARELAAEVVNANHGPSRIALQRAITKLASLNTGARSE